MFIDEIQVTIVGGEGGPGKVSFFPMKGGPNGGNGGKGGDVYAVADPQMMSLNRHMGKHEFRAQAGGAGGSNRKEGANGKDLEVPFPLGTVLVDPASKKEYELFAHSEKVLIARGGRGGLGNEAFKTDTYQTPKKAEPGWPGEARPVRIVMKLIADYGLIGLPNAGKSSLLNEITAANAKTAHYPFTTLEPNLGVLNGKVIADIPGLIEGASGGKGLGIKFLKHIEKTRLLIHCISSETEDIKKEYDTVMNEMTKYNPKVAEKSTILLLTKVDLISKEEAKEKLEIMQKLNPRAYPISIHDWDAIENLKRLLTS